MTKGEQETNDRHERGIFLFSKLRKKAKRGQHSNTGKKVTALLFERWNSGFQSVVEKLINGSRRTLIDYLKRTILDVTSFRWQVSSEQFLTEIEEHQAHTLCNCKKLY